MTEDTENDKKPDEKSGKANAPKGKEPSNWSKSAKVGAAVGSAAIAAALIYAGRHQMKKHDDFKLAKDKPLPKYENEPDYDDEDDDDDGLGDKSEDE